MAQATTALSSGWVEHKVLNVFKYSTFDNANIIWKRLTAHYSNVTDIRQLTLRDKAERCRQRPDQHLMDWIGVLNSRVAELAASGHDCDDTYRKQLVRHNSNDKFKPVIQQILLQNPRSTYEEFLMALLEAAADMEEPPRQGERAYFMSSRSRARGRRSSNHGRSQGRYQNSFQTNHGGANNQSGYRHSFQGASNRGSRERSMPNRSNQGTCSTCGGRGHFSRQCANNRSRGQSRGNFRHRAHHAEAQDNQTTPDHFGRAFAAHIDLEELSNNVTSYVSTAFGSTNHTTSFSSVNVSSTGSDDDSTHIVSCSSSDDDSFDVLMREASFSSVETIPSYNPSDNDDYIFSYDGDGSSQDDDDNNSC